MKAYLETEPQARERSNKNKAIANLLIKRYPSIVNATEEIANAIFTDKKVAPEIREKREQLISVLSEAMTFDRAWRHIEEHHPKLRGSDWEKRDHLARARRKELGYKN